MDEFVRMYPGVAISLLSALVGIVASLLGALFYTCKKSIDDLAVTLKDAVRELKEDRKTDRDDIGRLLDRMQHQETVCVEHRKHCPVFTGQGGHGHG